MTIENMKRLIKIKFVCFWPGFDEYNNIFVDLLKKSFDVIVCDFYDWSDDIDILFCGSMNDVADRLQLYYYYRANNPKKINTKVVYYSGENNYPNFNFCDYAIGNISKFHRFERYHRFPTWAYYTYYHNIALDKPQINEEELFNRKFCSFVVSNNTFADPMRNFLFEEISKTNNIDSGGKFANNIGYKIGGTEKDKINFLKQYKFNLACENSEVDGYVTEKIVDAFVANSIPIYWGDEYVLHDFNRDSYIYVNEFMHGIDDTEGFNKLLNEINIIRENKELYLEKIKSPKFNCKPSKWYEQLQEFLEFIVVAGKTYNHCYGNVGCRLHSSLNLAAFNVLKKQLNMSF